MLVPTIPNGIQALPAFEDLRRKISEPLLDVVFDFTYCKDLSPAGIAFIGGLARLVRDSEGKVAFGWDTCSGRVSRLLRRSGLAAAFGIDQVEVDRHVIPYREDKGDDPVSVGRYLRERWLGQDWIQMTPALQEVLAVVVMEVYLNAFEHGNSPVGVISCGEHQENSQKLRLAVLDFGIGIPQNVRTFKERGTLRASTAMKWAFEQGTTTRPVAASRGMGLDLLRQFVKINKGELQVFSYEGAAQFRGPRATFNNLEVPFRGTLVEIMFRCDDVLYGLASEADRRESLFT